MKRPKIEPSAFTAENGGYDYYRHFVPNKTLRDAGFFAMNKILPATVLYAVDQEQGYHAGDVISRHLVAEKGMLWVVNHVSTQDSTSMASIVQQEIALRGAKDKVVIPAAAFLHKIPVIGKYVENVGSHPTFRGKKYFPDTVEGKIYRDDVNGELIKYNADHINKGGVSVIHGEGGSHPKNPSTVSEFKSGIGRITSELIDPATVLVSSFGIAYRFGVGNFRLRPVVAVGQTFCPDGMSPLQVTEASHSYVQEATTAAYSHAFLLGSNVG